MIRIRKKKVEYVFTEEELRGYKVINDILSGNRSLEGLTEAVKESKKSKKVPSGFLKAKLGTYGVEKLIVCVGEFRPDLELHGTRYENGYLLTCYMDIKKVVGAYIKENNLIRYGSLYLDDFLIDVIGLDVLEEMLHKGEAYIELLDIKLPTNKQGKATSIVSVLYRACGTV